MNQQLASLDVELGPAVRDMNLQGASVDIQGASLSASRDMRIAATDGSANIAALENTVSEGGYSNRYMMARSIRAVQ